MAEISSANPVQQATASASLRKRFPWAGLAVLVAILTGTEEITVKRVGKAIADYQRTRLSGNSPYDRWKTGGNANAVSADVKKGSELFLGKAGCIQCHFGQSFTDNIFHNLGVGWDPQTRTFEDQGGALVRRNRKKAASQETQARIDGKISDSNTMPFLIEAVRAYATVGEICDALRQVYGTYEETSIT